MTSALRALSFDANDPQRLARFWAGVLGWEMIDDPHDGCALMPNDDTGFRLRFVATRQQKSGPNQMHLDLTSTSFADQQQTVARSVALGARHIDIGQRAEDAHVVLADPEGNEFCVIAAGNEFLADCGFIGAIACDGSQQTGYFWSEALGWPLVWDQNEETAIRAPYGGPKITWGGAPWTPGVAQQRLRLELVPTTQGDLHDEVDRLVGLGASRSNSGTGAGPVVLADPDGNEFWLQKPVAK